MSNELAREVTKHLGGDWKGHFGLAPGPGHGKHDRSLTIRPHRTNPKDVVLHSFAGDDWQGIKDELRRAGVLPKWGGKSEKSKPAETAAEKAAKEKAREEARREEEREAERKREAARRLWQQAHPAKGTEAEEYLLYRLRNLPPHLKDQPLPLDMIRYLPAGLAGVYPAMIAPFAWPVSEPEPGRLIDPAH